MSADAATRREIPDATVARLPEYLRALTDFAERGTKSVSSEELATAAGVRSTQLRKDLSHLGSYGVRGVGYEVDHLAVEISRALGLSQDWPVAIVGMGNLGRALAAYSGFASGGFHVAALFDDDPTVGGGRVGDVVISPMSELRRLIRSRKIAIGVITTPAPSAQQVCDAMAAAGVRSILNFAPAVLTAPPGVNVRRVDLSTELHVLAFREMQVEPLDQPVGVAPVSLLVIGLSHHTAPIALLEAVAGAAAGTLAHRVAASDAVGESVVLTTCNRLEVYAEAVTFHGAVAAIGESLAEVADVDRTELTAHLYVHFEDRAVAHAFAVAAGLDSMAVGEAQVLGQLRDALRAGQRAGTVGESLNSLLQQALRVGKRAHHETAIDTVSRSLVEAGLDEAERVLGDLSSRTILLVGAGGMSSLAATTAARRGVGALVVANRTLARGERLAETTGGRAVAMERLVEAIAEADVVISSTGSAQYLVGADLVAASAARNARDRVFVDLALPHDIDPAVAELPGTTLIGLVDLGAILASGADVETLPEVQAVRDLVTGEVAGYVASRMVKSVAPTVAALRSRAAAVVASEMERLDHRLPDLDDATRQEFQHAVHRVVEKLLHTPTVRVKELTSEGHGEDYAAALRELFDLDPHTVAAVSTPPTGVHHDLGGAP